MDVQIDIDMRSVVELVGAQAEAALQAGAEVLAEAATNEAPRDQGDLADSLEVEVADTEASFEYTARDEAGRPYPTFVHEKWDPWFSRAVDGAHDAVVQAMRGEIDL